MPLQRPQNTFNQAIIVPVLTANTLNIEDLTGRKAGSPAAAGRWGTADISFSDGQAFTVTAPVVSQAVTFRSPGIQLMSIVLNFPNPTIPGYPATTTTETYERTVWVGVGLSDLAIAMVDDIPGGQPLLMGEPFLLLHLGSPGANQSAALIPLTIAGRPYPYTDVTVVTPRRAAVGDFVSTARGLQDLYVQRGMAVAPPELWRAAEGVYFAFEQTLMYAGVAPGLAPLVENFREAVGNDLARGYVPLRTPAVISALGAILSYAVRARTAATLYGAGELASPPNRHEFILPSRSTANWGRAISLSDLRSTTVSNASLVAFQSALAPRDLERDEAVMRWLYVYATGACLLARRMGEQLGRVSEGGLFRYPASMFLWNYRDGTQTAMIVDTNREDDAAIDPRQYIAVAQTRLGLLTDPEPAPVVSLCRNASAPQRAIAPEAQARQVLGQNKQQSDWLIKEGQELLRLRGSTGEIARVRSAADVANTAPAGHPGEGQSSKGGVVLEPTGLYAQVVTRLVAGWSGEALADATNAAPFFLSPGQAEVVLNDVQDASETQRAYGAAGGTLVNSPAIDTMSWDPTRALAQATLPEGGGVRYWPTADTGLSDNAIDIVVGPVDISRIDRTFNGAEPFQDLLNVLVQGKV